jgi:hypothetical protein
LASRLPLAVLVTWFALLAGAAPAWGCAASLLEGGCCPDDSSAPCPGSATMPVSDDFANACCTVVPAPAAATPLAFARVEPIALTQEGSPDPLTLVAATTAEAQAAARHTRTFDFDSAPAFNAAPIYLRTSRLRL